MYATAEQVNAQELQYNKSLKNNEITTPNLCSNFLYSILDEQTELVDTKMDMKLSSYTRLPEADVQMKLQVKEPKNRLLLADAHKNICQRMNPKTLEGAISN